jgi:hypothetical protein
MATTVSGTTIEDREQRQIQIPQDMTMNGTNLQLNGLIF